MAALRAWVDWTNHLVGGGGPGGPLACCAGVRRSGTTRCRDLCLPAYRPTDVEALEVSRENLAVALFGQILVVTCRCLTGNVAGGLLGMVVFILGNHARCSLKAANLTGYVVVGFTIGTLDAATLVARLADVGLWNFLLGQDMTGLAVLLAPAAELVGARAAWQSYVDPQRIWAVSAGGAEAYQLAWQQQQQPVPDPAAGTAVAAGEPRCAQCGAPVISSNEGWQGSGTRAGVIYCHRCWGIWAASH